MLGKPKRDIRASATEEQAWFPLTEAQSGLWYAQRIEPDNPILNTGQYLDIEGVLDIELLRTAVRQAVGEAEALSLTFADGREPMQLLDFALAPALQVVDLSASADAPAEALRAIRRDTETPLDLTRDPLAAFILYVLGPRRHFLYERIHHLAIDGYGMVLVTNRIAELYSSLKAGNAATPPLPPLSVAVDGDRAYIASERRTADAAFWRAEMANCSEIPAMAPGRAVSAHSFHRETILLDAERIAGLRAIADAAKVTWPDALTALVAAYCRRFTGSSEVVAGVPFMGRLGSPAARVPCMLMNVLPLRVAPDEAAPLTDYLVEVSRKLMKVRRHGRYRSEQLRRDLGLIGGQRRLYGPLINVQPFDMPPAMAGLAVTLNILGAGSVDDITFSFRGDAGKMLMLEVDSNPNLYSRSQTAAHARRLVAFLEAAAQAPSLAAIPTASPEEAKRFVFDANDTTHAVPDVTLTALIEAGMRDAPDRTALVFAGQRVSYAELDRRTAALAAELTKLGAGPETIIAVALPRSIELLVALVAILRSGAAYLPLDLDHPRDRLRRIAESAKPLTILTLGDEPKLDGLAATLPSTAWPSDGVCPVPPSAPGDMAYVIYTSGSTGEPKGVVVEHRAIVNRLEWMRQHYGFGPHDRILQKTPATFDVSVWEFFLPLISGATLVIAPPGAHRDPSAIASIIREEGITTAHFVPSMLSAFLAAPSSQGLRLSRVFCSGEELTADQRDRFHRTVHAGLHNLYGPTEAAVDVSFWPASPEDTASPVPIGFPVWNTALYVLDESLLPVPPGVPGHLFLGGVQLARGYLGRPDLTAERFIANPFRPGERMYRTGDLARLREDGAVVFLGRSDHQVKVRGLRIELGEIEAAVMASGQVRETGVIAREDRPGDRRIVAYVVPSEGYKQDELSRALSATLPDYMIPSAFVALPSLPVTSNGKLDRSSLPAPKARVETSRAPATETEAELCSLVAETLGLATLPGPDSDFFALGGDSLLAVHLMLRIQDRFGRDPGLGVLFEHPTIFALARLIDSGSTIRDDGLAPLIRLSAGPEQRAPLFFVHPAGGISWCYRQLAGALSPARSVYGLQSPALDPRQPMPASLAALASDYVSRIDALHGGGPIHLAGWSVGGIIAQEMAVQMRDLGRQVGVVALLDSYPCDCWRAEPNPDETAALRSLIAMAGFDPQAHPELLTRDAIVGFLRDSGSPLGSLPEAALDGVIRVVLDTNRLVRGHYHRRFDGTLTHVRAALDHKDRPLVPELWEPYAAAIDRLDVPFLHPQLTTPVASALIAPALAARMASFDDFGEDPR